MPAPVWPAVTTASASPSRTRSRRDEDRRVLLLAQREGGMLVHADDLDPACTMRTLAGSGAGDRRGWSPSSTDEDQLDRRVAAGEVEGARDDLGRAVVAAHRVERDADAARSRSAGLRSVVGAAACSGRLRARRPGGPGSSRSSGRRGAAASSRGSADTPRASAGRSRGASGARPGGHARRVAWVHPWGRGAPCVVRGARSRDGARGRSAAAPTAESTAKPARVVGRGGSLPIVGERDEPAEGFQARVDVVVGVVVRRPRRAAARRRSTDRGSPAGRAGRSARPARSRRGPTARGRARGGRSGGAPRARRRWRPAGRSRGRSRAGTPPRAGCRSASSAAAGSGRIRRRATCPGGRRRGSRGSSRVSRTCPAIGPASDEVVGQVDASRPRCRRCGRRPTPSPSRPATFQMRGPSVERALIGARHGRAGAAASSASSSQSSSSRAPRRLAGDLGRQRHQRRAPLVEQGDALLDALEGLGDVALEALEDAHRVLVGAAADPVGVLVGLAR